MIVEAARIVDQEKLKSMNECLHCGETIDPHEKITQMGEEKRFHRECMIRMISGSLAHQTRRCSCYGGKDQDDDEKLTRRENARRTARYFTDVQEKVRKAKFN